MSPDPSVGFVFRSDDKELVLFFTDTIAEGTYNGERTSGLLDHTRDKQFERWKKRYAKQELETAAAQARTTPSSNSSAERH